MESVYRLGRATVSDVIGQLADPPSYSSIRAQLRILEEKGHLRHEEVDGKYVYFPVESPKAAGKGMLGRVVDAFFGGSHGAAALSLLGDDRTRLTEAEITELEALIARAKEGTE